MTSELLLHCEAEGANERCERPTDPRALNTSCDPDMVCHTSTLSWAAEESQPKGHAANRPADSTDQQDGDGTNGPILDVGGYVVSRAEAW